MVVLDYLLGLFVSLFVGVGSFAGLCFMMCLVKGWIRIEKEDSSGDKC